MKDIKNRVQHLMQKLKSNNIEIVLSGKNLKISYDEESMTEELLNELKTNKIKIIAFLEKQSKLDSDNFIPKIEEAPHGYPLTPAQRRVWILSQDDNFIYSYNVLDTIILKGELNRVALEASIYDLIERHEILRTVFDLDESGNVKQFIKSSKDLNFKVDFQDIRNGNISNQEIQRIALKEMKVVFDFIKGPMIKCLLLQIEDRKWVLVSILHHVICDSWSFDVLKQDILIMYKARIRGEKNPLLPLRIQYKDFAVWREKKLEEEKLNTQKEYWLKQFEGAVPVLNLPTDRARPVEGRLVSAGLIYRKFDGPLLNRFKSFCSTQGGTLFTGLMSLLNLLLFKYTEQNDIVIGFPIHGRVLPELESQIGFFADTLALRTQFNSSDTFKTLLKNVNERAFEAYANKDFPFDELVNELNPHRDSRRNVLFDVVAVLQNFEHSIAETENIFGTLEISKHNILDSRYAAFDLIFNFAEKEKHLSYVIEYNKSIFDESTIQKLGCRLEQLMSIVLDNQNCSLNKIDFLTHKEKAQLLAFSNVRKNNLTLNVEEEHNLSDVFIGTSTNYDSTATLNELFEKQVSKNPQKIALFFKEKKFTYQTINERANQLAGFLRAKYSINPDDLIGIQLDRSEWMIISILAVLKAGGAYVPIDPDFPQDRIDYILKDSQCKAFIDAAEIEKFITAAKNYSKSNLLPLNKATDLAYVIYTSGSTGRPKGCMLEHQGLVNRIDWMWNEYKYTAEDTILQKTTFTFDVSVWEIFMPLCWGTKMVLCEKADIAEPERILSLIEKHKVSCLHFVPSMFNAFINSLFDLSEIQKDLSSLRLVITSGEALPLATVRNWYNKMDIPIHNLYGPTEASIDVTYYATSPKDIKIPIGRPIWNTQIYILNPSDNLQPIGLVGEICIASDGLARGYLNKAELTAERFVTNPFNPDQRMYRTGDLGKWLPDGNIEFIGRNDDQVKIRGYRIELGEIENVLKKHQAINNAVVLANKDKLEEYKLVAYLISDENLTVEDVQTYLLSLLPLYMLPAEFVMLTNFPLTLNGKINKNLLREENKNLLTETEYVAPRNEIESTLVDLWKDILDREKIGIKDDFLKIGGHSLKATRLIAQIRIIYGVKLNFTALFEKGTIENICLEIEKSKLVNSADLEIKDEEHITI